MICAILEALPIAYRKYVYRIRHTLCGISTRSPLPPRILPAPQLPDLLFKVEINYEPFKRTFSMISLPIFRIYITTFWIKEDEFCVNDFPGNRRYYHGAAGHQDLPGE